MDSEKAKYTLRRYEEILRPYELKLNSRAGAFRVYNLYKLYKNINRLLMKLGITYTDPTHGYKYPAVPIYLFEPDPEDLSKSRITTGKINRI